MKAKNIIDLRLRPQADLHIVPKQEFPTDSDDVPWNAVILGSNSFVSDHRELGSTKSLFSLFV
jgi:hypothetical protein